MGRREHLELLTQFEERLQKQMPVKRIVLLGARARAESDFDLLILSPAFRRVKRRYRGLRARRLWMLDYPVDFLCYTPEEFEKLRKQPSIVSEALREGVEI